METSDIKSITEYFTSPSCLVNSENIVVSSNIRFKDIFPDIPEMNIGLTAEFLEILISSDFILLNLHKGFRLFIRMEDSRGTQPASYPLEMINLKKSVSSILKTIIAGNTSVNPSVKLNCVSNTVNVLAHIADFSKMLEIVIEYILVSKSLSCPEIRISSREEEEEEEIVLEFEYYSSPEDLTPFEAVEQACQIARRMGGIVWHEKRINSLSVLCIRLLKVLTGRFGIDRKAWISSENCKFSENAEKIISVTEFRRSCWTHNESERSGPVTGSDGFKTCETCSVFINDIHVLTKYPTRILLVSIDESILYTIPMYLSEKTGYSVVPLSEGRNALKIAEMLEPDLIIVDDYLKDMDPVSLIADLQKLQFSEDIRILSISSAKGSGSGIMKPLSELSLISSVNMALISSKRWLARNRIYKPVILLWSERVEAGNMLSRLFLDSGAMLVSVQGPFELAALAMKINPHLIAIQSGSSSSDAVSLLDFLCNDKIAGKIPLLLIGGNSNWLKNRISIQLNENASAFKIRTAMTKLLSTDCFIRPPLLVMKNAQMSRLIQIAFMDRLGQNCPVADNSGNFTGYLPDFLVYQGDLPPDSEQRKKWRDFRVIIIGSWISSDQLFENEIFIPWNRFTPGKILEIVLNQFR